MNILLTIAISLKHRLIEKGRLGSCMISCTCTLSKMEWDTSYIHYATNTKIL